MRARRPLLPLLVLGIGIAPAPLAARQTLTSETTQELYAKARDRATQVTSTCRIDRQTYLEALVYLYAYYQVASRDGSLNSSPDFNRTFQAKYRDVQRTAEKCLGMERNSSSNFRDDGTGPRIAPPPPIYRVDLPDPPPPSNARVMTRGFSVIPKAILLQPGASAQFNTTFANMAPPVWRAGGGTVTPGGVFTAGTGTGVFLVVAYRGNEADTAYVAVAGGAQTDAQGRTIPQLVQENEQLRQQRDGLAAEVNRLRNPQPAPPPPPPPNLSGEYRIQVVSNNLFWHEDGNGDRRLSTRYQPDDDFTRFILEIQADGSYRIRVKANGRYLHAPGHEDWIVSTLAQVEDDYTRFIIVPDPGGSTFKLRQKATGRFLGIRADGLLTNNPQSDDNSIRFRLIH